MPIEITAEQIAISHSQIWCVFMTLPLYDTYILRSLMNAWILQIHSVWMSGTWGVQKWQLKNKNLEVNLVNRDHINCRTAIYSCLIMLIFFVTEVSFAFGFIRNDLARSQHVTKKNVLCVCVCVCFLQSRKCTWTKIWMDHLECCSLHPTY